MVIVNCRPPPRAKISSRARAPAIPLPITTRRCLWVITHCLSLYCRAFGWFGGNTPTRPLQQPFAAFQEVNDKRSAWLCLFHTHRADFEFRHFRDRIERWIGQQIDTGL